MIQTLKTSVDDLGVVVVANTNSKHEQNSRVYSKEGLSPTITTMQGGNQELKVLENLKTRDQIDSSREIAPLKPAEDAVVINADCLGIDQVLKRAKGLVYDV